MRMNEGKQGDTEYFRKTMGTKSGVRVELNVPHVESKFF